VPPTPTAGPSSQRRHDVDWLRTGALVLLIVFHVLLTFQSWAAESGFPQNQELLEELVPLISLLTVWRIPLLFLISGMGVRFAMERRDWKALLKDRAVRILFPFLFGTYFLGALLNLLLPLTGWNAEYAPHFGHLWFLLNIFLYVVWLVGILMYLKEKPDNRFLRFLARILGRPWGIFLFAIPAMVEAAAVRPQHFALYVDTLHGWLLGLVCFFTGFLFICLQREFWPAVTRARWVSLLLAVSLYVIRWWALELRDMLPWLTALESMCWMLALLGFGAIHLNRPSRALSYLSGAVYPVYIVHLPLQFTLCYFVLPLPWSAWGKLAVLMVGTFAASFLLYELVLRRIPWVRPFFGMKVKRA